MSYQRRRGSIADDETAQLDGPLPVVAKKMPGFLKKPGIFA